MDKKLCSCGNNHPKSPNNFVVGENLEKSFKNAVERSLPMGKGVVITSQDIFEKIAQPLIEYISSNDRLFEVFKFERQNTIEFSKVKELNYLEEDVRLVVAIGCGGVIESAKYFAFKRDIPLIVFATSPSVRCFFSNNSVLEHDGIPQTMPTKFIDELFMDVGFISQCSSQDIASCFGEIVSKYIAVYDWHVAKLFAKSYFCEELAKNIVESADQAVLAGQEIVMGKQCGYGRLVNACVKCGQAFSDIPPNCMSGSEESCAKALGIIQKHNGIATRTYGENAFLMYTRLVLIYELFFSSEIEDVALFPDVDERFNMLVSEMGLSEEIADKLTSNVISAKAYNHIKDILKSERGFLKQNAKELKENLGAIMTTFTALYDGKNGNWIKNYNKDLIKYSICLSTEINPRFNGLSVLKYCNALEGYLARK